jgi:hypothetical protein
MRQRTWCGLCLAWLCMWGLTPVLAEPWTLKMVESPLPEGVSAAVQGAVDKNAGVFQEAGKTQLTLWPAQELPLKATADQIANGITYRELAPGCLLGVMQIHQAWTDFRKQTIEPGVYTLRLTFQPRTGDHEGTAPHTEFAVLCPAGQDSKPEPLTVEDILDLGPKTTDAPHVSPLLLFPIAKPKELKAPQLTDRKDGITTFDLARTAKDGKNQTPIGIAFTIRGVSKER